MGASFTVRGQPVFYNNAKFAEVTGAGIKFNMNSQPLYPDAGYAGESEGAIVCELTITAIRPEEAPSVDWIKDALARRRIPFDIPIGGGQVLLADSAKFISGDLNWKNESGMFEGSLTYRFGEPHIQ